MPSQRLAPPGKYPVEPARGGPPVGGRVALLSGIPRESAEVVAVRSGSPPLFEGDRRIR